MALSYGLAMSVVVILSTLPVMITIVRLYRQMGTDYFKYLALFFLGLVFWMASYFVQISLLDTPFEIWLPNMVPWLRAPAWLCLCFLVVSGEIAKKYPNRNAVRFAFLVTGVGIGLSFEPTFLSVQIAATGLIVTENIMVLFTRLLVALTGIYTLAPMLIGIFKMLNKNPERYSKVRLAYIAFIASGVAAIFAFLFTMNLSIGSGALYFAAAFTILFSISGWYILRYHPTLFLAARHDLVDLIIIEKGSGLPVFTYHFEEVESAIKPELISAFVTSARIALHEAMPMNSEVEHFHFGEASAILHEGLFVFGIILSRQNTDLLASLLRLVLEEFESSYWFYADEGVSSTQFEEFSEVVEKYFEFDLYPMMFRDTSFNI